jgi:uncharacterized protein
MVATIPQLQFDAKALTDVCERFGVRWLAVFGSVAHGEARPDSDIDVLYRLTDKANERFSLWDLVDLGDALSPVFGGRYVDLGQPDQVKAFIRDSVLREAIVIYEK